MVVQKLSREGSILVSKLSTRSTTLASTSITFWVGELERASRKLHRHAEAACCRELTEADERTRQRAVDTVGTAIKALNELCAGAIERWEELGDPRAGCGVCLYLVGGDTNSFGGEGWYV